MSRILVKFVVPALLAVSAASRASAALDDTPPAATQESAEQLARKYQDAMFDSRFADALAVVDRMHVDPDYTNGVAIADAMRASALLGLKRDSEAHKLIAEANSLAPELAEPSSVLFLGALLTKHFDVAADTIDRMIARYPDAVRDDVDWELMRFFMANEPKAQTQRNEDRTIALAAIGYGGDTERGHYLAKSAVDYLVNRGDFTKAADLLRYVKEPVALESMLIQKRYAPLWDQIEQLAGPHFSTVRADSVSAAKIAYEANPNDADLLANYVNTLRHAQLLKQAIALKSKLPSTSEDMASADEDMGWAVNNVAYALDEAGQKADSDRLFALLNDAKMDGGAWRISMRINRLELLVGDDRDQLAATLLDRTEAAAKTDGSPFAQQLVRRLQFCTLSRLGRTADAAKRLSDLLAHASDAPGPTIDALLCAGDVDRAEQVALSSLASPDAKKRRAFEEDFVRQLQAHPLTSDDPSVWQGRWAELRKRPRIASAFDRLGRDMPQEYLPPPPQ